MILTITPECIEAGNVAMTSSRPVQPWCPVDQALAYAGFERVTTAYTNAWGHDPITGARVEFDLSRNLTNQIQRWEAGQGFRAGRYRLKRVK